MTYTAATFSKDPTLWGLQNVGQVIQARDSSILFNTGKSYLDWTSSLGQWVFGQTDDFRAYIAANVFNGLSATLPFGVEYELAEKLGQVLADNVPSWAGQNIGVRFGKSGTDATTAAVRLARAVTGRDTIVTFKGHYHGWQDWSISRVRPGKGIIGWTADGSGFLYDDLFNGDTPMMVAHRIKQAEWGKPLDLLQKTGHEPAAVIFEHPPEAPPEGWQHALRTYLDQTGALLIVDEVVCWPRCGLGGSCGLWGYEPDIVCIGKGLGNGAAVSAIAARFEIMEEFMTDSPVFVSSTTAGNPLDMAAGLYVVDSFSRASYDRLVDLGSMIMGALLNAGLDVYGHEPRSVIRYPDNVFRGYFIKAMARRGHLVNRPQFPNLAMTEDDVFGLGQAAQEVMNEILSMPSGELRQKAEPLPLVLFEGR